MKLDYVFEINARVSDEEPVETKHQQFINLVKAIPGDWGINDDIPCIAPVFGQNDIVAVFSFYKKFRGKIRGHAMYVYRRFLKNDHSCDDRLYFEFNAKNINSAELIGKIFAKYIVGFNSYAAGILPYDLFSVKNDIPFEIRSKLNYRCCQAFFKPFHFMDNKLITDVFNLSPEKFYHLLNGNIYKVEKLNNGVYLQASDRLIDVEEAKLFNLKVQELIGVKLPCCNGKELL